MNKVSVTLGEDATGHTTLGSTHPATIGAFP
jgi:hypothetical protein